MDYEYRVIDVDEGRETEEERLNKYTVGGWELVSVLHVESGTRTRFYLKRPATTE